MTTHRSRGPADPGVRLRLLAAGLVALLLAAAAPAQEPTIPAPRGFVSDFANVIDRQTASHLEALITELQAKTGAEIAIVTVESTQPLSAFDYAMKIAERWKPGAKGKDNGVVFLVAVKDRELFILTGYGIEGALPDGRVGEIRDRVIVPRFRQGDYRGGIRAGTEALAQRIAEEYRVKLSAAPPPPRGQQPNVGLIPLVILIVVLILISRTGLWPLLFMGGRGRGGGFGGSFGGGGFGGSGGGFGGFGGGGFGGGGAGGRW